MKVVQREATLDPTDASVSPATTSPLRKKGRRERLTHAVTTKVLSILDAGGDPRNCFAEGPLPDGAEEHDLEERRPKTLYTVPARQYRSMDKDRRTYNHEFYDLYEGLGETEALSDVLRQWDADKVHIRLDYEPPAQRSGCFHIRPIPPDAADNFDYISDPCLVTTPSGIIIDALLPQYMTTAQADSLSGFLTGWARNSEGSRPLRVGFGGGQRFRNNEGPADAPNLQLHTAHGGLWVVRGAREQDISLVIEGDYQLNPNHPLRHFHHLLDRVGANNAMTQALRVVDPHLFTRNRTLMASLPFPYSTILGNQTSFPTYATHIGCVAECHYDPLDDGLTGQWTFGDHERGGDHVNATAGIVLATTPRSLLFEASSRVHHYATPYATGIRMTSNHWLTIPVIRAHKKYAARWHTTSPHQHRPNPYHLLPSNLPRTTDPSPTNARINDKYGTVRRAP